MTTDSDLPPLGPNYVEALQKHIAEFRAQGHDVRFETWNESHHGQAAINILNGLPPDADPSEVKGCFNDWLQDLLPPSG